MQQETQGVMCFLKTDGKFEDTSRDLTAVQASYAETVLELQKTRDLLLLQHRLNADLQVHTVAVKINHNSGIYCSECLFSLYIIQNIIRYTYSIFFYRAR